MRSSTSWPLALLALLPLALVACDDDGPPACPFYDLEGTALSRGDAALPVRCVQPAYAPQSADSAFIQFIDLTDTLRLVVFFPLLNPDAPAYPTTVGLERAALEVLPAGASDWQIQCDQVVDGSTLRIDRFTVDPSQVTDVGGPNPFTYFSGFEGHLDLHLDGCTLAEWDLGAAEVHLHGPLAWRAK